MRLSQLPAEGKVVVAHPNREEFAKGAAAIERCDYLLRRVVADKPWAIIIDMDTKETRWMRR